METANRSRNTILTIALSALALLYLVPLFLVLMNSFKGRFFISDTPFAFPDTQTWVGLQNYVNGIAKTGLPQAFGYSLFITVFSVAAIVFFTSMTAWCITRVRSRVSSTFYYLLVFSMIVPFQMVMFTMSKVANVLHLDNPVGIIVLYLGFGAGLSVFIFSGFVRSIPIEIEEASTIDGCTPIQTFFLVVFPLLRPIYITIAILNTMWIWNDYLLPYLVIGSTYRTIPIAVQYLQGGYGSKDLGAMMAMLVLAIIPIVIFYLFLQKYIIEGVAAGAVKG
jgi:raffinose/stachyose/melibiose transport system permease protein